MPWGAVVGAVIGGVASNQAAKKGANATNKATQGSIEEQRRQFDLTRQDQLPWLQSGTDALGQMKALNSGDFSSFRQSPDYQFAYDQGMQGLDRSAAARGGLYSGGHSADVMKFASGLASQNYNTFYNHLQSMAGQGQTTASNLGTMGMGMASNIGNSLMAGANARASSYAQQGQNYSDIANGLGQYYTYYHQKKAGGG